MYQRHRQKIVSLSHVSGQFRIIANRRQRTICGKIAGNNKDRPLSLARRIVIVAAIYFRGHVSLLLPPYFTFGGVWVMKVFDSSLSLLPV